MTLETPSGAAINIISLISLIYIWIWSPYPGLSASRLRAQQSKWELRYSGPRKPFTMSRVWKRWNMTQSHRKLQIIMMMMMLQMIMMMMKEVQKIASKTNEEWGTLSSLFDFFVFVMYLWSNFLNTLHLSLLAGERKQYLRGTLQPRCNRCQDGHPQSVITRNSHKSCKLSRGRKGGGTGGEGVERESARARERAGEERFIDKRRMNVGR